MMSAVSSSRRDAVSEKRHESSLQALLLAVWMAVGCLLFYALAHVPASMMAAIGAVGGLCTALVCYGGHEATEMEALRADPCADCKEPALRAKAMEACVRRGEQRGTLLVGCLTLTEENQRLAQENEDLAERLADYQLAAEWVPELRSKSRKRKHQHHVEEERAKLWT